jgi:hypothetical protein
MPLKANAIIPEAIVEPTIVAPINNPHIPIIPPMAAPAMINPIIDPTPINITAVEPALAPAIDAHPLAVEPALAAIGPTTIHPIQPLPCMLPHTKCTFKTNRHALKQNNTNKNVRYCYTPERQLIPNAVVPAAAEMPKGISEYNYKNNKNNRNSFFQVCYDNTYIRYAYGPKG